MKKIVLILLTGLLSSCFVSCQKTKDDINEATEFDLNYSTNLTVPASSYTVNMPVDVTTPEIPTESAGRFASEKTAANLVSEIKLTKFNISTTDKLDFLKSISIYIKSTGLSDVLVATKTNFPAGSKSVAADLKDVNIKDYIFKDKIQFRATVEFASGITTNQVLKVEQTLHVKATLLK